MDAEGREEPEAIRTEAPVEMPCSFAEAAWTGTLGDNAFMDILVVKVTDFKHLEERESPHQHALHRRSHIESKPFRISPGQPSQAEESEEMIQLQ